MLIRQATPRDAHAFGRLLSQLDQETRFMLLEPGERAIDDDAQAARFERMHFLAERESRLAGFLGATGGSQRRSRLERVASRSGSTEPSWTSTTWERFSK